METEVEYIESENIPCSSTQYANHISIYNVDFNLNLSTSSASTFGDNSFREENDTLKRQLGDALKDNKILTKKLSSTKQQLVSLIE